MWVVVFVYGCGSGWLLCLCMDVVVGGCCICVWMW